MKNFLALVTLLFTLISLPGCVFGNGEGYGFKPVDSAPQIQEAPTETFFELSPGYTCQKDGVTVPSYVRKIQIIVGDVTLFGDACSTSETKIKREDLEFPLVDKSILGYQTSIFERRYEAEMGIAMTPKVAALCTDANGTRDVVVNFNADNTYTVRLQKFTTAEGFLYADIPDATKDVEASAVSFSAREFSLNIDTALQTSSGAFESKMKMLETEVGEIEWDLYCRFKN